MFCLYVKVEKIHLKNLITYRGLNNAIQTVEGGLADGILEQHIIQCITERHFSRKVNFFVCSFGLLRCLCDRDNNRDEMRKYRTRYVLSVAYIL